MESILKHADIVANDADDYAFDPCPHITRLQYLERLFGATTTYRILEPFPTKRSPDTLWLQKAARKIANFLDIKGVSFIVNVRGGVEHAGEIELDGDRQAAFIQVSSDVSSSDARLLGTLAHEITHKLLELRGVPPTVGLEYELLTDTAAIFFGLGKLILAGCETDSLSLAEGGHLTTTTYRVGYLLPPQVAFVIEVVCFMRGLPREQIESGVHQSAVDILRRVHEKYAPYFRESLRQGEIDPSACERCEDGAHVVQSYLAHLESSLREITSAIDKVSQYVRERHQAIKRLREAVAIAQRTEEHDPCARYLNTIAVEGEISRQLDHWEAQQSRMIAMNSDCETLVKLASSVFARDSSNGNYSTILSACPIDGTPIASEAKSPVGDAICPKCGYRFVREPFVVVRKRVSLRQRLRSLMGR